MQDLSKKARRAGKDFVKPKSRGVGLINVFKEIKRKDLALLRQRKFNHDILDTLADGVAYTTLKGKIIFVNHGLENILEISKDNLIGRDVKDLIKDLLDQEEQDQAIANINNVIAKIKVDSFQVKYKNKVLEICPNISLVTKRLTATIRDVTETIRINNERKHIEEQLLEKNKDFSRLFDISIHLLESIESNVLIQKIVDQAANLVGTDTSAIYLLKEESLILKATSPHLPDNFPEEFRLARLENHPHILKVIETGYTLTVSDSSSEKWTPAETEIVSVRNLGSMVYIPLFIQKKVGGVIILGTINRTHKYDQHEIDLFTIYSNITSLALENSYLFENLTSTKEKAEESNRLKSAFLHNISHEIRTPLNAIIGFSELLGNDNLRPELRYEYRNIISQSNNQLLSIINDILDISYIEARQINLTVSEVIVSTLLRRLYVQYQTEASLRKLDFRLINKVDSKTSILIDEAKIIGILTNLLNNAFKFTHKGSVELGCELSGDSIQFFVRDTGIGISKTELSKIFERFYQIDKGHEKIYGGMGLGLSICAAYTELLGGQIHVESESGKGSLFKVTLPMKKTNQTPEDIPVSESVPKNPESKKILVAEDDDTNFSFINAVLSDSGYQTLRAVNGLDAIQICSEHTDISLVLMDVRMPVKDGYSAANDISKFRPQMPIIFQSAYGLPENRDHISKISHTAFLNKPFTSHQLVSIVENTLKECG